MFHSVGNRLNHNSGRAQHSKRMFEVSYNAAQADILIKENRSESYTIAPVALNFKKKPNQNILEIKVSTSEASCRLTQRSSRQSFENHEARLERNGVWSLVAEASSLYKKQMHEEALLTYRFALNCFDCDSKFKGKKPISQSNYAKLLSNISKCCWKLGRTDDAITFLERIVAIEPSSAKTYYMIAQLLNKKNDPKNAKATLLKGMNYLAGTADDKFRSKYVNFYRRLVKGADMTEDKASVRTSRNLIGDHSTYNKALSQALMASMSSTILLSGPLSHIQALYGDEDRALLGPTTPCTRTRVEERKRGLGCQVANLSFSDK